jgi:hypothetical protein
MKSRRDISMFLRRRRGRFVAQKIKRGSWERLARPYRSMKGKISAISTPAAMTDATCPAVLAPMACIKIKF